MKPRRVKFNFSLLKGLKHKKMERKEVKCFVCKKGCPCKCLEIDTDMGSICFCSKECYNISNKECSWGAEFGDYDGHYSECHLGGHFEEKWKEVVKQLNIWRNMADKKHHILHKIGYYGDKKSPEEILQSIKQLQDSDKGSR